MIRSIQPRGPEALFFMSATLLYWVQPGETKPGVLVESEADVHRLHRLAGCTFHQVVQRRQHDDAVSTGVELEADVTVVAAGEDLGLRVAVQPTTLFDQA